MELINYKLLIPNLKKHSQHKFNMSTTFFTFASPKFNIVDEPQTQDDNGEKTPYKGNKLAAFTKMAERIESDQDNSTELDSCSIDIQECPPIAMRLKEADFDDEIIESI